MTPEDRFPPDPRPDHRADHRPETSPARLSRPGPTPGATGAGDASDDPRHVAVRPREDRALMGIVLVLSATACFCGIDTSGKWLILVGLPALQVAFIRYAGHLLIALAVYLPTEGPRAFRSQRPFWQVLRSTFLMLSTVFNFAALAYLPLTTATTINFAGPILVTLLSAPILGERVGPRRLAAVAVGFLGVLVVIQPWGANFHPAMLLSVAAMSFGAFYMLTTRYLAGQESNAVSQIWSSAIAAAVLAPLAFRAWVWPDTVTGWLAMAAVGAFGVAGHSLVNIAYRYADASLLAPFFYLQLIFAALAGFAVFGAVPAAQTLAGAAIIIASGAYIGWREQQLRRQGRAG